MTSTPGAETSGLRRWVPVSGPWLENSARRSFLSTAATVSAEAAAPGDPTVPGHGPCVRVVVPHRHQSGDVEQTRVEPVGGQQRHRPRRHHVRVVPLRAHLHAAGVRVGEVDRHDVLGAGQVGVVDDIAGDQGEVVRRAVGSARRGGRGRVRRRGRHPRPPGERHGQSGGGRQEPTPGYGFHGADSTGATAVAQPCPVADFRLGGNVTARAREAAGRRRPTPAPTCEPRGALDALGRRGLPGSAHGSAAST